MTEYSEYLTFLSELHRELAHLIEITRQKIQALEKNDLDKLNACTRQEQASALALRGCELRRQKILTELSLADVPVREMANHCPPQYKAETEASVTQVLQDMQQLRDIQTPVRTLMEQELRDINRELERRGVMTDFDDSYQATPSRPAKMRTDIKA